MKHLKYYIVIFATTLSACNNNSSSSIESSIESDSPKQITQEQLKKFFSKHRVGRNSDYAIVKNGDDYFSNHSWLYG